MTTHALDEFAVEDLDGLVAPKEKAPVNNDVFGFDSEAAPPIAETALEQQEHNGFVVSVVLAVAVIGYGGLLAASWQTPAEARVVTAPRQASEVRVVTALAAPVRVDRSVVQPSVVNRPAAVRPVATTLKRQPGFTPNARTLNTLWQRRDTRSLDRAFTRLRSETLAFRSCGMRMTSVDRAVARCEGITIDFKRTSGRWSIARVTTR